jgi:hypothetical protein
VSGTQELAAALRKHSTQSAEATPSIRGADWRTATVDTVNTDGTVTTTDGIIARRLVGYQLPAVGDRITISQSALGGWIALDRTAPKTGDGWQTPTLTTPWAIYSGGGGGTGIYQLPRFRRAGNEVIIEGLVDSGGATVTGGSTILILPSGYRPALAYSFSTTATTASRQLSIFNTGVVQVAGLPGPAVGFLSLNCRFSIT